MRQFPAFIELQGRPIPVIGGGDAALRKARLLLGAGARVRVIWPDIEERVSAELDGKAVLARRAPLAGDFADAALAIIAIGDRVEARRLAGLARIAGALVNVVDQPELCDFTMPAIIDRGEVTVAISTNGAAPVLGRRLRAQIEALLPRRTGALARFARNYRASVKGKFAEHDRKAFWERFFGGPIASMVLAGDEAGAHEAMIGAVNRPVTDKQKGVVHLVGAGPGDPDLLTLKALRLLQSADVILYDRLVGDEILTLARRDAERLYVGKAKSSHCVPQHEIEQRMIDLAHEGKIVVRLKGGDPFVFGRGGEELEALRKAGIDAFVTPGVTAATACAAAAGMALTHRDHAQAVTFVTGHARDNAEPDLDWGALAALGNTLVVYMGVSKAKNISDNLIAHGRSAQTPVAIIENGARDNQKIIKGDLGELPALIAAGDVKGPALLVIGAVAALASEDLADTLARQERISA